MPADKVQRMTIHQAACSDDELTTLRAMRDKLAADMDAAEPGVVAQIAGRLEAILKRITELGGAQEATLDDVLAERRKLRAVGAGRS